MISIIIPTYNTPEYLKECVNSIPGGEIIIGIDGCEKTLQFIKAGGFEHCKVFYFPHNRGPYIVKNNLVKETSHKKILFFDSDDLILPLMLPFFERSDADLVRYRFEDLDDKTGTIAWGVFGIKKSIFETLYFENWKCNADLEFLERIRDKGLSLDVCSEPGFLRRRHPLGLTSRQDTGMESPLRKSYEELMKQKQLTGWYCLSWR